MDGGLDGGAGMDGGMGFLNRTEPNRKKNRPEPREPKPSQNPSEKPKRTETNRGFTDIIYIYIYIYIYYNVTANMVLVPTTLLTTSPNPFRYPEDFRFQCTGDRVLPWWPCARNKVG